MTGEAMATQPVTAVVQRRIKPGLEASFESLMRDFMAFVLRQPGHLGINVIRTSSESREYTVLDRFATEEDRQRFTALPEYQAWMERLRAVSEDEPEIQEMGGLAFWFVPPNKPARRPPPQSKMALLTLLGVYPLSMLFPILVKALFPLWPAWLQGLAIAALITGSLTWIVMPRLTTLFEKWLFPSDERG